MFIKNLLDWKTPLQSSALQPLLASENIKKNAWYNGILYRSASIGC